MVRYEVHTLASAPEGSRATLEKLQQEVGFLPNLVAAMAESPTMIRAFTSLRSICQTSALTAVERELVAMVTSFENDCAYCMAAHSTFASKLGAAGELLEALRAGEPPIEPRSRALYTFARHVSRGRGRVSPSEVECLVDAGYTQAQALEVLVSVSMTTLANQMAHVARTPVDAAFQTHAWERP
jgi:uncharacterized peroxidase-related enzyme